jgi:hypothetical protein
MSKRAIKIRLEELREELRAERISYGEIAELQGLAEYIDPDDVELLEAAGVPEFKEDGIEVYDNGGRSYDRYTVVLTNKANEYDEHGRPVFDSLGLSHNPDDPQGFSQWGQALLGPHLGEPVELTNLPENVQKHIKQRLAE